MTGERHGADFTDGVACYQLKVRRCIPGWLWGWLSGIQGTAKGKGKAGVLVLKQPRQQDAEAIVILSWRDWVELHGKPRAMGGVTCDTCSTAEWCTQYGRCLAESRPSDLHGTQHEETA